MNYQKRAIKTLIVLGINLLGYLIMLYLAYLFFCCVPLRSSETSDTIIPTPPIDYKTSEMDFKISSMVVDQLVTSTVRNVNASTRSTAMNLMELTSTIIHAASVRSDTSFPVQAITTTLSSSTTEPTKTDVTVLAQTRSTAMNPTELTSTIHAASVRSDTSPVQAIITTPLSSSEIEPAKAAVIIPTQIYLTFQEVTSINQSSAAKSIQVFASTTVPTTTSQRTSTLLQSQGKNVSNCPNLDDYSPCVCTVDQKGHSLLCRNISLYEISAILRRTKPASFFLLDFVSLNLNKTANFSNIKHTAQHIKMHCEPPTDCTVKQRLENPFWSSFTCETSLLIEICSLNHFPNLFGTNQLAIKKCGTESRRIDGTRAGFQCLKLADNDQVHKSSLDGFIKNNLQQSKETLEVLTLKNRMLVNVPKSILFFTSLKQLRIHRPSSSGTLLVDSASVSFKKPVDHLYLISPAGLDIPSGALGGNFQKVTISVTSGSIKLRKKTFKSFLEHGGSLNFTNSQIACVSPLCDLAWLHENHSFLQQISGGHCVKSGTPLKNFKPPSSCFH